MLAEMGLEVLERVRVFGQLSGCRWTAHRSKDSRIPDRRVASDGKRKPQRAKELSGHGSVDIECEKKLGQSYRGEEPLAVFRATHSANVIPCVVF